MCRKRKLFIISTLFFCSCIFLLLNLTSCIATYCTFRNFPLVFLILSRRKEYIHIHIHIYIYIYTLLCTHCMCNISSFFFIYATASVPHTRSARERAQTWTLLCGNEGVCVLFIPTHTRCTQQNTFLLLFYL